MDVTKTKLYELATQDEKKVKIETIINDIKRTQARFELEIIEQGVVVSDLQTELIKATSVFPLDFNMIIEIEQEVDLAKDKTKRLESLKKRLFDEVKTIKA
jgi:hypothetical protein